MDPRLNDTETDVRDRLRAAAVAVAEAAEDVDGGAATAADAVAHLAAAGVLGVCTPESHGGDGGGLIELALACEEIGAASASVAAAVVSHLVAASLVEALGDEGQGDHWLPRLARGEEVASVAIDAGGSLLSAPAATVVATQEEDGFRLEGVVRAVAGATFADLFVVPARAEGTASIAVVDAGTDGVKVGSEGAKLGLNGAGLASIEFLGVRVDATDTLSSGETVAVLDAAADTARIGHAALSVGIGRAALEASTAYVAAADGGLDREQSVQWMLADMATETEAARLLTWYAASREKPDELREAAAMARLLAADAAVGATRNAVQIFGAEGNERGSVVERLYRDAKAMEIHHGGSDSQRLAVARQLLPDLFEDESDG